MRRFWRIRTFPLNSRLWKLESEATGKKKSPLWRDLPPVADLICSIYSRAAGRLFNFPDGFHGSDSYALDNRLPKVQAGTERAAQPSALFTCRVPRSHSECGGRASSCLSKVLIVGADMVKQKHFDFLLIQIFFFLHLRRQLSRFL